ncbi:MAG: thioesterase family protein [Flavobacteriaceae bacterium]
MTYTYKHVVTKDEIDFLNHVNNVVYLQWINDVSLKHWLSISNKHINSAYYWVAVRHEIDYKKSAFLKDTITLKTWIDSLEGVKSIRIVEVYKEDILIAKSKTIWCLMDAKTEKISKIPDEIKKLFTFKDSST